MWLFLIMTAMLMVACILAIGCAAFLLIAILNAEWKRAWFCLTGLCGLGLLTGSVIPGRLDKLFLEIPYLLIGLPLFLAWLGIPFLLAFHDILKHFQRQPLPEGKRWGIRSAGLVVFICVLLMSQLPKVAVFSLFASQFQALVPLAPSGLYASENQRQIIGPFTVDKYCSDNRGGVYFRTSIGFDLIDTLSYGFAYRPNPKGTPFGNADYVHFHLFGDWHTFSASNDW